MFVDCICVNAVYGSDGLLTIAFGIELNKKYVLSNVSEMF